MSTPEKLRGKSDGRPESELTKFKTLWRTLSDSAREFWLALFSSGTKQADIRKQISAKLKINLSVDKQLTLFRQWLNYQAERDAEMQRQLEDEQAVISEHPDWSLDRAREEVLKRSYFRTLASGDFKLGLKTVKADQNERVLQLDRDKFMESVRTKLESALADLATHIKSNPKAKAAYEAFRAEIQEST